MNAAQVIRTVDRLHTHSGPVSRPQGQLRRAAGALSRRTVHQARAEPAMSRLHLAIGLLYETDDGGELVKVSDLYFARAAVDELRGRLVAFLEKEGQLSPTQWKELVGQSRKFTIPLAEYFDAQKVTLRVGDLRKLRR